MSRCARGKGRNSCAGLCGRVWGGRMGAEYEGDGEQGVGGEGGTGVFERVGSSRRVYPK